MQKTPTVGFKTVAEIAEQYRVTADSVYSWIRSGSLALFVVATAGHCGFRKVSVQATVRSGNLPRGRPGRSSSDRRSSPGRRAVRIGRWLDGLALFAKKEC